jgi:hypothetical protein
MRRISQLRYRRHRKDNEIGLKLLLTVSGLTTIGGFLADWNRTHLFNPNWPPHCKFHDAISISLASMLGITGGYLLLKKEGDEELQLKLGALLPAFFWSSMGISFFFPHAKGLEAEFPERVPKIGNIWFNEGFACGLMLSLIGVGYASEVKQRHFSFFTS